MAKLRDIDVKNFYTNTAKRSLVPEYEAKALELAGEDNEVVLTGAGPGWLYLKLAHALRRRNSL